MIQRIRELSFLFATVAPFAFGAEPVTPAESTTTWMPEVTTTATTSGLLEDRPADETGRPEWTNARRFANSRVYIQQAPWEIGIEQWWRVRNNRDDTVSSRFIEEVEIGLPYRMQLDLYERWEDDNENKAHHEAFSAELRWALADWDVIPMNPTLYAEYVWVDKGSDVVELKLLLGGDLGSRWHYGINFVYEKEFQNADRVSEFQITGGLGYTILDSKVSIGVEAKFVQESTHFDRGEPEQKYLIGPSMQIRLTERLHMDFVCLFGTNYEAQRQEGWFIVGYDFGKIGGGEGYQPVSGMGR